MRELDRSTAKRGGEGNPATHGERGEESALLRLVQRALQLPAGNQNLQCFVKNKGLSGKVETSTCGIFCPYLRADVVY